MPIDSEVGPAGLRWNQLVMVGGSKPSGCTKKNAPHGAGANSSVALQVRSSRSATQAPFGSPGRMQTSDRLVHSLTPKSIESTT